jgi:trehalose/maltose hydrolase-like predicted phosphorylase
MFPWTSAAKGYPFGCCAGGHNFENCIEQHITPDVGFFLQQIYRATGDRKWLETQAFPVVKGVAEWLVSRVHKDPDGSLHINGVMPIGENPAAVALLVHSTTHLFMLSAAPRRVV